jgi:hypothetical protein
MAQNLNQIDIGQSGGAFIDDTGAFTPPTGKVVTAIQIVTDNTSFDLLTPNNSDGLHYPGTSVVATAAGNGLNAEAIATSASGTNFPAGMIIYGRFSAITLADGAVIAYFSEE